MIPTKRRHLKLPALLVALGSWSLIGIIIYFVNPEILIPIRLIPVWPILWIALTWTIWIISSSSRRAGIFSTAIVGYLVLRFVGIGHLLNGFLLLAIALTLDWYLSHR